MAKISLLTHTIVFSLGFLSCWAVAVAQDKPIKDIVYKLASPHDIPADEWRANKIYLYPETYPELLPVAKEILSDGFVSKAEGDAFWVLLTEVQEIYSAKRKARERKKIALIKKQLLMETDNGN